SRKCASINACMHSSIKKMLVVVLATAFVPAFAVKPAYVDITWMSIANIYYEIGGIGIMTDGYVSRIPQNAFYGGGGGLGRAQMAYKADVDAVTPVLAALGGKQRVQLLLTGHSHFDHSFDTATWSQLTGAPIIGSKTTCFQAIAEHLPTKRCKAVYGGEK